MTMILMTTYAIPILNLAYTFGVPTTTQFTTIHVILTAKMAFTSFLDLEITPLWITHVI